MNKIVYHGSQSNKLILEDKPIYLVTDKSEAIEWAKGYAFGYCLSPNDKPTVYTIEVSFTNPKILKSEDDYYEYMEISSRNWFIEELTKLGYDGCIYETYYMPLHANKQCKIINKEEITDINEQKAYHGSNANFDKFDLSKFQRGDYGYGIYFTRSKGYANDYGTVKEYDIPDNEYLLSWEDTWQYQSEYVYNCLDKLFDDLYDNDREAWEKIINIVDRGYGNDGEGLYMNLSEILKLSSKQTSELLYKYGIKGIDSFKGNCQVIFNPKDITLNIEKVNECLTDILENYHGVK